MNFRLEMTPGAERSATAKLCLHWRGAALRHLAGSLLLGAVCVAAVESVAWGAPKYGDAAIESGSMEVLREGEPLQFTAETHPEPVTIYQDDLIRVGEKSLVRLDTVEKAVVTLGSNAILHVSEWRRKSEQGWLSILYGRLRAQVQQLTGAERFDMKTATATIGIKGTDFHVFQAATGSTVLVVTEGFVEMQGLTGVPVEVAPGNTSVSTGREASPPIPTTETYQEIIEENDLGADPVESEGANDVPDEAGLTESGATTAEDMEESKQEEPLEEAPGGGTGTTEDGAIQETAILSEPPPPPEPETIMEISGRLPVNIEVGR